MGQSLQVLSLFFFFDFSNNFITMDAIQEEDAIDESGEGQCYG